MIKFVFRICISFLLHKIIQGIIVNNKCPDLNVVKDFKYPANNMSIIWKMHSHLPTDKDQQFIQPFNFLSNFSFDCAQFSIFISNSDVTFIYISIKVQDVDIFFKLAELYTYFSAAETHKYALFYDKAFKLVINR